MGRRLSASTALSGSGAAILLPGQLPVFGSGRLRVFRSSQSWTVPAGVSSIRVRVNGGGAGLTEAGSAASFGNLISATGGGMPSGATPGTGGVGLGGDFQAAGGRGGAGARGGGGAAGSELGDGGNGGAGSSGSGGGGGAVGGKDGAPGIAGAQSVGAQGASPYETPSGVSQARDFWGAAVGNPGLDPWVHPIQAFVGAGGMCSSYSANGGPGGAGAGGAGAGSTGATGGAGGVLGGGGGGQTAAVNGGAINPTLTPILSNAMAAGAIGGGSGGDAARAGCGGGGYARGVFAVLPGQTFQVTVPPAPTASSGLVIVEW